MTEVDHKRTPTEAEELPVEVMLGAASRLAPGRITGVLIITDMDEITGGTDDYRVQLVSQADDRSGNFLALLRFLRENRNEIPFDQSRAG